MYFLKISGHIPRNKQIEFEQTYHFAITQIPGTCDDYNISKDVLKEGVYYFISYWPLLSDLESYIRSAPFLMITGAFKTLGALYENTNGKLMNMNETQINTIKSLKQIKHLKQFYKQ